MFVHRLKLYLIFTFSSLALFGILSGGASANSIPAAPIGLKIVGRSASESVSGSAPSGPMSLPLPLTITVIRLEPIGTFASGLTDQNAAENLSFDPGSERLFVVNANGASPRVDIIDLSTPSAPSKIGDIDTSPYGAVPTSVDVHNGMLAVTVVNAAPTSPGKVAFFNTSGTALNSVTVGAQPDVLTFTPDGQKLLVANEGEPSQYCVPADDPEGSVSIIDISGGVASPSVSTATFTAFNGATLDPSIRIFGPGATVAQDLEPEGITVSADSKIAWITLQENNAMAILDVQAGVISDIVGLGFKDHNRPGNGLDASDQDGGINIVNWPAKGMYQPDGIAAFQAGGSTFLVTANEGEGRTVPCPTNPALTFTDEARMSADDLELDTSVFPNFATLELNKNLGRLKVSQVDGDTDSDGHYEEIYSFGGRSFSIWNAAGQLVFDSGDGFERITAAAFPNEFNSENDQNGSKDKRSDNKGPEPEAITTGVVGTHTYAFIALEQIGGVMVFKITDPSDPTPIQYVNTRNFSGDVALGTAGDLSPTDLIFIPANASPNGKPLLVVANSASGTTTVFGISELVLTKQVFLPVIQK